MHYAYSHIVTSNPVHLLVMDTGGDAIPRSMQLAAAQTAQRYNKRKGRRGAFWEDRYHATAVQTDGHLQQCITYIDLNMVRAGVVTHPAHWRHSGFGEIQAPPQRYSLIDLRTLCRLCGFDDIADLQSAHRLWVETALTEKRNVREARWTEAPVVGSKDYVERFEAMGEKHRLKIREPSSLYSNENTAKNGLLRASGNGLNLDDDYEISDFCAF